MQGIASFILLVGAVAVQGADIEPPRLRPSPYFGSVSGIKYADVKDLGKHNYDSFWGEKNPLVYTAKAGYIDIGHLRESADRARYLFTICNDNILKGNTQFSYTVIEPAVYTMTLDYPDNWQTLSDEQKRAVAREVSIELGQHLAQQSTIWHEVVTWYGYSSVGLLSEQPSSFSWEDTYSDLLGTKLAAKVLREENAKPYDKAMTEMIARELKTLQPLSAKTAKKATSRIKGKWYSGTYPFVTMNKRNFDVGYDDGAISPFRVPGMNGDAAAQPCTLGSLDALDTHGFTMSLELRPKEKEGKDVLKIIDPDEKGTTLQPAVDFPKIIAHIRNEAVKEAGAEVDKPTLKTSGKSSVALTKTP